MLSYDIYIGDTGNLLTSDNHLNFRWRQPDCNILFSVTQQGNAAVSHFTSDKSGLRRLKEAVNDWCEFCFYLFEWCEMVIGVIEKPSVTRLAEKCGFKYVVSFGKQKIYARRKSWVE